MATKRPAKRPMKAAPRADYGQPIADFIARRPAAQRKILVALRKLIEDAAPRARASLKWGMPFFTLDGTMML